LEEVLLASAFVLAFAVFRGLYGRIPFLLALGLSGILAFLSLTTVRLVRAKNLRFGAARLKRDGRVTSAGWIFAVVMGGMVGLWAHSALVRFHEVRGDVAFNETEKQRVTALDLGFQGLDDQQGLALVERGSHHIEWTRKWGLFSNPASHFKAAWFAFLQGRDEAALVSVERALEVQPGASEVHLLYGRILAGVGRPREAVMAFVRSVEINPEEPQGFISLGSFSGGLGDVSRAREVFRRGLLRHPGNADLHYNFGVACAMEGDIESAVSAFERTLEINPEHEKARENLTSLTEFRLPVE